MIVDTISRDILWSGTKYVFDTLVFLNIQPSFHTDFETEADCLIGMISFKGELEGYFSICSSRLCAQVITSSMLKRELDESLSPEETYDAFGELANMIMGRIKASSDNPFHHVSLSVPLVIHGKEIQNSLGEGINFIATQITISHTFPFTISLFWREKRTK